MKLLDRGELRCPTEEAARAVLTAFQVRDLSAPDAAPRPSGPDDFRLNHELKMKSTSTPEPPNQPLLLTACLLRARRCHALAARTAAAEWHVG